MEIEWTSFGDAAAGDLGILRLVPAIPHTEPQIFEMPVDLVGGREEKARTVRHLPERLQQVERPAGVHFEIQHRIGKARRNGGLRGKMEHPGGAGDRRTDCFRVPYVGDNQFHRLSVLCLQPCDIPLDTGPREVVQEPHTPAIAQQPIGNVRRDEAGPPGNEGECAALWPAHPVSPRAASSRLAWSTWSCAVWSRSHSASSTSPSSSLTCGS